jgi:hypothetical protein
MTKHFSPDPRYLPSWPASPFGVNGQWVGWRMALLTPIAERLARRIQKIWSAPSLTDDERSAIMKASATLECADCDLAGGHDEAKARAEIERVNGFVAKLEGSHGTPAPAGGDDEAL